MPVRFELDLHLSPSLASMNKINRPRLNSRPPGDFFIGQKSPLLAGNRQTRKMAMALARSLPWAVSHSGL
jgi:hypothetical protein